MATKRAFADFRDPALQKGKGRATRQSPSPSPSPSPSSLEKAIAGTSVFADNVSLPLPLVRRSASLSNPDLPLPTVENVQALGRTPLPTAPRRRTVSGKAQASTSANNNTIADDARPDTSCVSFLDCAAGKVRLDRRPSLLETLQQIVGGSRASSKSPPSAQAFDTTTLSKMQQRRDALTVAERLMPFLVKRDRALAIEQGSLLSGKESDRSMVGSFELDRLDWNVDQDFAQGSVPFPASENPKPNLTFGFQPDVFDGAQREALSTFEPELSGGIASPFFAMQWKGFAGSMPRATNRARREGAAMVHSRRKAMERIGIRPLTPDHFDLASMAFTCAVDRDAAHLHIHWVERAEGKTDWLMAIVAQYRLEEEDDIRDIRCALHRILYWGLSERLTMVKAQLDIYRDQAALASRHDSRHDSGPSKRRRVGGR